MANKLIARCSKAAGILFGAALLAAPTTGYAADAKAPQDAGVAAGVVAHAKGDPANINRVVQIVVTDTGFDKKEYTVYSASGTNPDYKPRVEFKNAGTMVHSITVMPGDGNVLKVMMSPNCFPVCTRGKFKSTMPLDTGGVTPGESFTFELASSGDITFTSQPDCLNSNATAGFDCTPVTLHVKSQQSGQLNDYNVGPGTAIAAVGDPDCMAFPQPVVPTVGPAFCRLPFKRWNKFAGSRVSL